MNIISMSHIIAPGDMLFITINTDAVVKGNSPQQMHFLVLSEYRLLQTSVPSCYLAFF